MPDWNKRFNLIEEETEYTDEELLEEERESSINEILRHFSSLPYRHMEDGDRYVYNKKDLEEIFANLLHPEYVKVTEEKDDYGNLFCYTLSYAKTLKSSRKRRGKDAQW